jgi:hypothetical protein
VKAPFGTALLGLAILAAPAGAQVAAPLRANWFMKDLRAGFCVQFLIAPGEAQAELGSHRAVPIEAVADRYPALARVAAAETAYQGWVPAEYCWMLFRSAAVLGKVIENDRGSRPVLIGYLAIEAGDLPDSATGVAVTVFTNTGALARVLNQARLQVDRIDFDIGPIPAEETSPGRFRYQAVHSGATIQWDGGRGDTRPAAGRGVRLLGLTGNNSFRGIVGSVAPDSAFVASGNLRVVGSGNLKRLLSGSPIRLVTPWQQGGDSDWSFGR